VKHEREEKTSKNANYPGLPRRPFENPTLIAVAGFQDHEGKSSPKLNVKGFMYEDKSIGQAMKSHSGGSAEMYPKGVFNKTLSHLKLARGDARRSVADIGGRFTRLCS
jgi:hypothetical protein